MTKTFTKRVQRRIRVRLEHDTDEVGYGKPPKAHRFKPGQSGNPKGRKNGAKNEATDLTDILDQRDRDYCIATP